MEALQPSEPATCRRRRRDLATTLGAGAGVRASHAACVYIIAKQLLKGWEIVKVGESHKLEPSWGGRSAGEADTWTGLTASW